MLIVTYVILALLVILYQLCFIFKPMFYKVEKIGNVCFFISLAEIIPVIVIGGWKQIFVFLGVYIGSYIVGLIVAGIAWRAVYKKMFNKQEDDKDGEN